MKTLKTLGLVLGALLAVPVVLAALPLLLLIGAWFWCLDPEGARAEMR